MPYARNGPIYGGKRNAMLRDLAHKIDFRNVRGILLDLDNTLYEYEVCHRYAMKRCFREFTLIEPASFKNFLEQYDRAKRKVKANIPDQASSHSRLLYFQALFEESHGKTNVRLTLRFERLYWDSFLKKMKLFDGARDFLKHVKRNGATVCIVTDLTSKIQLEKIQFLKIDKYVDFVVSSEEAGKEKPAPHIFKLALKKMGLKPKEVVIVGDDRRKDGRGGMAMGIKTILVNSGQLS